MGVESEASPPAGVEGEPLTHMHLRDEKGNFIPRLVAQAVIRNKLELQKDPDYLRIKVSLSMMCFFFFTFLNIRRVYCLAVSAWCEWG